MPLITTDDYQARAPDNASHFESLCVALRNPAGTSA
jgi:hypothetical protein